jgi:hypothetical protein
MSASRSWAELSREHERLAMPSERMAARGHAEPDTARGQVRSPEPALAQAGAATSAQAPS